MSIDWPACTELQFAKLSTSFCFWFISYPSNRESAATMCFSLEWKLMWIAVSDQLLTVVNVLVLLVGLCSLFIPLTTIADQWPVFSGQKCSLQNDNFQLVENVRLNLSDFQLFRVEPTRVSDFLLDKFVLTHFRLLLNWFSCQNFTFLS